jgi:hypothetical protein
LEAEVDRVSGGVGTDTCGVLTVEDLLGKASDLVGSILDECVAAVASIAVGSVHVFAGDVVQEATGAELVGVADDRAGAGEGQVEITGSANLAGEAGGHSEACTGGVPLKVVDTVFGIGRQTSAVPEEIG